ncbi:hypothetical protein dsx2_0708 [Desulfovibrio sp. X2]|uniref:DUF6884 domain-containing protein n=1 Tax=Desulfovibrio sp. X2 TaxID=941449 RepID=UPI000358EF27|nr:DUF6884 domain-containing protein [Desulfovibrio sp. X2]EPR37362.1 hypothetical protein dsx2_0708 [Desulfovibrio sp. X2]
MDRLGDKLTKQPASVENPTRKAVSSAGCGSSGETIGLVACASSKGSSPTSARDLYVSPLFCKSRKYAELHCDDWYILSAKHGLLDPEQVISPYSVTLNGKSQHERKEWADRVWEKLRSRVRPGTKVIVLAGKSYREFLESRIKEAGGNVLVPLAGKAIGLQLQWLTAAMSKNGLNSDLDRFYAAVADLEKGLGGRRTFGECSGRMDWPDRGVYLIFEPGEFRSDGVTPRVVRVGTHAVSVAAKSTLWSRLRAHRGTLQGSGNHRASIFRLHVGRALAQRDPSLMVETWGVGQSAPKAVRKGEERLERAVSEYIARMCVLWLNIDDAPGRGSDRAYLERQIIGLLSADGRLADPSSENWLGRGSFNTRISDSGLWNLDYVLFDHESEMLDRFEAYVAATVNK